ncbi:hypothetical protein [Streptomyces sp. fd1-xmd]|uniref:hypothetical protein n=1 Tax=Streptomyces sp. fd1-xmd TaxID=1812480 RepID=UPI0009909A52|nr:hypothetical protein [Streptomyces sp. fd1-xmd]AQT70433.1 hypothetical protein B1K54_00455 [Streptomyces sp. fd1-xmd]
MDQDHPVPWQDRLGDLFEALESDGLEAGLEFTLAQLQDPEQAKAWLGNFKGLNYQAFALRLLGAGPYRLLVEAVKQDGAVLALAIRRGMRALMPFAVAWSDAVSNMSVNQRKAVAKADVLGLEIVQGLIELDDAFGKKFISTLPMQLTTATADDLVGWQPDNMPEIVASIRQRVGESSARRLERENSQLVRKIKGARTALAHSEDGISQAANSLIELIDRIMREAFTKQAVLVWVDANLPDEPQMTFTDKDGKVQPSKRAEALCFVYRGGPTARQANEYDDGSGPTLFHDVFARVIVATRDRLQKLKHSDGGTPEEKEQLLCLLAGLEGALMLGLSINQFGDTRDALLKELDA